VCFQLLPLVIRYKLLQWVQDCIDSKERHPALAAVVQLHSLLMVLAQMLCILPYMPEASGLANNALHKVM